VRLDQHHAGQVGGEELHRSADDSPAEVVKCPASGCLMKGSRHGGRPTMLPAFLLGLLVAHSTIADTSPAGSVVVVEGLQPIKWEAPAYPNEARRAGLSGEVVLRCSIGNKGKVSSLKILSGVSPLYEAAIYKVLEWQFDPAVTKGRTSPEATVTMRFQE